MVTISGCEIKLFSNPDERSCIPVLTDKFTVLNVGSQMLFSLLLCGLAEVWLSEHTEEHIVSSLTLLLEAYMYLSLHDSMWREEQYVL